MNVLKPHLQTTIFTLLEAGTSHRQIERVGVRIHEGLVWSNRDRRTLLDKMLMLLGILAIKDPFYLVVEAYYAAGVRSPSACSSRTITCSHG